MLPSKRRPRNPKQRRRHSNAWPRVTPNGPRIEAFPVTLHDDSWAGYPITRKTTSNQQPRLQADTVTVYCQGIFTSGGSPNDKPRGAAAAVLKVGNEDSGWGATSTTLLVGETVTKADCAGSCLAVPVLRTGHRQSIYMYSD